MSIALIKELGLMPPNELTPIKLAQYFEEQTHGLSAGNKLAGHKAVGGNKAWLGHSIVGKGTAPSTIALIGKGITFDAGGISIKPSHNMHHMKFDMLGCATVLALEKSLHNYPGTVHLYGCCAENTFHFETMRPGDVLTYDNGTKVEVIDTDAEGRLVLADGILAAKKHEPDLIITIATLTGSARAALGNGTAIFGNKQPIMDRFLEVATKNDEFLWQLPIWEQHRKNIKGQKGVSDIKNLGTIAGASTAAAFLEHFVDDTPWVHLDIAGSAYKNDVPTGAMFKTLKEYLQ
jgi:leucyl aminopeptidase